MLSFNKIKDIVLKDNLKSVSFVFNENTTLFVTYNYIGYNFYFYNNKEKFEKHYYVKSESNDDKNIFLIDEQILYLEKLNLYKNLDKNLKDKEDIKKINKI